MMSSHTASDEHRIAVSVGSLDPETLKDIRELNDASNMLRGVQWSDMPTLRYLGELKRGNVANLGFEAMLLSGGVCFSQAIQSNGFSSVMSMLMDLQVLCASCDCASSVRLRAGITFILPEYGQWNCALG